jgi:hypothetical protein
MAGWIPASNRQLKVAESIGFKGDFREWEHLLRIGDWSASWLGGGPGNVGAVCQLNLDRAVAVRDLLVRVGSDLAYTIGTEHIEATLAGERGQFEGRVTNIYRREAGGLEDGASSHPRWCRTS